MKKTSNVGRENGQGCSKYKGPEVGRNLFFSPCACVEPLINPRMLLKLLAHRAKDFLIPATKHTMFVCLNKTYAKALTLFFKVFVLFLKLLSWLLSEFLLLF